MGRSRSQISHVTLTGWGLLYYLVSLWASCEHVLEFGIPMGSFFSHNFGIRMGPNFWLGRQTPTDFQRKNPAGLITYRVQLNATMSQINDVCIRTQISRLFSFKSLHVAFTWVTIKAILITWHWIGTNCWNPSSRNTRIHLCCSIITMTARVTRLYSLTVLV